MSSSAPTRGKDRAPAVAMFVWLSVSAHVTGQHRHFRADRAPVAGVQIEVTRAVE